MTQHSVTFIGQNPVIKHEWRIRCECGWTEKAASHWRTRTGVAKLPEVGVRTTLMLRWERHVYTPHEMEVLRELGG